MELYKYLNGLSDYLQGLGRRAMMWGDQLLNEPGRFTPDCITYGETPEIAKVLVENLDRKIIIVDWQYYVKTPDITTGLFLKEKGFDVIMAPFDDLPAIGICAGDVVKHQHFGFMQTTWHVMHTAIKRIVIRGAAHAWEGNAEYDRMDTEFMLVEYASYTRKLLPPKGIYRDAGLRELQIDT